MKLFVTIAEQSPDAALNAIGGLTADHDGVEVRIEQFHSCDPSAFRAATRRPLILTRRGAPQTEDEVRRALEAGIDLVDVEYAAGLDWVERYRDRVVLSHHDFAGMPDVGGVLAAMRSHRCAHTKLAVTPKTLADNISLLEHQQPATTLIGMGERGLYSRILAPFLGTELAFVSPDGRAAAPGQLTLARALDIYGSNRDILRARKTFAVAGNPAGHSLSPSIHNALFRSKGVPAAYTIASVASFEEIADAIGRKALAGVSVTAPFKEDAFEFARRTGARVAENASACRAVNTLVRTGSGIVADNTDVDGFTHILARLCGRDRKTVALIGAGGTARAAVVALNRAGMNVIVYNRTESKARALGVPNVEPLESLSRFDGEIIINTIPDAQQINLPLRPGMTYIETAYGSEGQKRVDGVEWIDGLELLRAQAVRQHELFMKVFDGA